MFPIMLAFLTKVPGTIAAVEKGVVAYEAATTSEAKAAAIAGILEDIAAAVVQTLA